MTFETETVLDRRLLRRRLSWWRGLAVVAAVLVLGLLTVSSGEVTSSVPGSKHIARVTIEGIITEDRDQLRMLKKIGEDSRVAGVVVFVNSGGGTTAGGEALYEALRNIAKTKPVVAQFGTVAASAAYIAGLGTDRIFARGNTITGSVGVLFQWAEVSQLMEKVGVKMNEVKSGPLKANPSPFQPADEAGKAVTQEMVAETQRWFLGLVQSRRGIDTARVAGLEQGRIYSGREALVHRLVDQIGGEEEAVAWLEGERKVPKALRIIDWKPKKDQNWGLGSLSLAHLADAFGHAIAQSTVRALGLDALTDRLRLDGLVSVWQGSER